MGDRCKTIPNIVNRQYNAAIDGTKHLKIPNIFTEYLYRIFGWTTEYSVVTGCVKKYLIPNIT
jgi:hypothetical protein